MRTLLSALLLVPLLASAARSADKPGKSFNLDTRVEWTMSRLVGSPDPPLPYTVEPTFAKIAWKSPIYILDEPGTDRLWIISEGDEAGRPNRFTRVPVDPNADEAEVLLQLPGELVYAICFDPRYATNRQVYVFSNGNGPDGKRRNRVARYTLDAGPPARVDPKRTEVILEWRSEGHDGGDLVFGADGMLYVVTGDGTGDSDTWNSGQTLDDLLGAVLRIDVALCDGERPYSIPPDNPFVDLPGACGEIWAYGLRNPWRAAVDPKTGHLWIGNNGQDLWETAHLVRRGENYGWSVYEGNHPFYLERRRGPTPHVPPTIEHSHAEFRSLTGGVVYYGEKFPELEGAYIYGDYSTGRIWAMKHDGRRALWHRELADTSLQITAFRADQRGELLVADYGVGIFRLVAAQAVEQPEPFPRRLRETGLFASTADHLPEAGLIPYSVNAPAWADGATAERFIALPGKSQIEYAPGASWTLPDGAALVQTFSLASESGGGTPARRVETRVLLRQQGEWAGYSYRWNDEQTDAVLVPKEGADAELVQNDDAETARQSWRFPSRAECLACHSRAANFVLGLSEAQLNREHDYGGVRENQLRALDDLGYFARSLEKPPEELARLANPYDPTEEPERRARSYLAVNCSVCHVAAGGGNAQMELAAKTPRDEMKLIGARPQHDTFGIPNAMLVAPGDPDRSVMLHRLARRGRSQMPPLVVRQVDTAAVELMRKWISGLEPAQTFVKRWTMDDLVEDLPSVTNGRSFASGQEAFRKTGCAECHRFAGEGGTVGPDLTGVEKRLKTHDLLESILVPSKVIADQYASYAIETQDGRIVTGRIEREDDRVLVVRPNATTATARNAEQHTINKASVVARRRLPVSNMPEGIVNVLEKDELLDLVAFLMSGRVDESAPSR